MIGYIRELFGGVVQGPFHQVAVDGLMALLIVPLPPIMLPACCCR